MVDYVNIYLGDIKSRVRPESLDVWLARGWRTDEVEDVEVVSNQNPSDENVAPPSTETASVRSKSKTVTPEET